MQWSWIAIVVIIIDQIIKGVLRYALQNPEQWSAIKHLFDLNMSLADELAASALDTADEWHRWLFIALVSLIIALLINWLVQIHRTHKLMALCLTLSIGGAISSLLDRFFYGHADQVFYNLPLRTYFYWPLLHFAEFVITTSLVVAVMIFFIRAEELSE